MEKIIQAMNNKIEPMKKNKNFINSIPINKTLRDELIIGEKSGFVENFDVEEFLIKMKSKYHDSLKFKKP
jgi:tricorn protease-like protein